MQIPDQHPVIVGTGQQTWREADAARTPTEALYQAASAALADCGSERVNSAIDAVATVRFLADTMPDSRALFPRNPGLALAARLGLGEAQQFIGPIGGNTPQFLVNHFAARLARGELGAVLLTGAELMASVFSALRSGDDLSAWPGDSREEAPTIGTEREGLSATEAQHGLYEPINTYPLFENSLRHHLGHDDNSHNALIAEISSRMSAVAASNPHAWRREAYSATDIATVARRNRYIGYPYTRLMNAVLEVDMAAAVVLTTAGKARELGIPRERWIFLRGGADAHDIWFPSERRDWHSSPAIAQVWQALSRHSGIALDELAHFDIYSCFPSAVQIACAEIGLSPLDSRGVTVTGGLPFFGGPGNNYSLHAIASMVNTLREDGRGHGLVTANGLYLTKHSLGLYSTEPAGTTPPPLDSAALQKNIDRGPSVKLAADPAGPATVETWTVAFDREGPKRGIVIARNDAGERVVTNTLEDETVLRGMLAEAPTGQRGQVRVVDGINRFEF